MTDSEPGGPPRGPIGPPARPPGPVPAGYVPREWVQQATPPTVRRHRHRHRPARRRGTARRSGRPSPPMPHRRHRPPRRTAPPGRRSLLRPLRREGRPGETPRSSIPPGSPRRPSARAGCGSSTRSPGSWPASSAPLVFGLVAGAIAGKTAAQMQAIATASVPPEWYVVSTLLGLWIGFFGAPWLASRTQGTRNFVRDLGAALPGHRPRRDRHRHRRPDPRGDHVRARSSTTSTTSTGPRSA